MGPTGQPAVTRVLAPVGTGKRISAGANHMPGRALAIHPGPRQTSLALHQVIRRGSRHRPGPKNGITIAHMAKLCTTADVARTSSYSGLAGAPAYAEQAT